MKPGFTNYRRSLILALVLAPLLLAPLTGCSSITIFANDPNNQCSHPGKPVKPYTDKKVAILITQQSEAIDKCRALLGH